jgi:hypothetical protein
MPATSPFNNQMKNKVSLIAVFSAIILISSINVSAQLRSRTSNKSAPAPIVKEVRATAAYAELIVKRTELKAELEELLVTYKDEFPKVRNTRYELNLLNAVLARFGRFDASYAPRLTEAVGKLIIRRAQLATDYWIALNRFSDEHPSAKKAKRKLEIYDEAVEALL